MSSADVNNEQSSGGGEETSNTKDECTSCEQTLQNNVDNINEEFNSMATLKDVSTCANCGKEGNSEDMNTCNKCKSVKYCNAACKKKHRSKHKKKCDRRVAELHDEKLFKEPPPREECPICFLPMPIDGDERTFKSCCGKTICSGCVHAMKMSEGKDLCPFCRTAPALPHSNEEEVRRIKILMDNGNGKAFNHLAGSYALGGIGLIQDYQEANELWLKAGELGCVDAYYNLGLGYDQGNGVEVDKKKAKHYFELAAMMGSVHARHNLGCSEWRAGNEQRAYRHMIIATRTGHEESMDNVNFGFRNGYITKDEYATTLRAYQKSLDEMKSNERDEAAKALSAIRRRGFR